jgi:hypothetical protein
MPQTLRYPTSTELKPATPVLSASCPEFTLNSDPTLGEAMPTTSWQAQGIALNELWGFKS